MSDWVEEGESAPDFTLAADDGTPWWRWPLLAPDVRLKDRTGLGPAARARQPRRFPPDNSGCN